MENKWTLNWEQKISEEIFRSKYMLHGESGPEEVFKGIAAEIASAEKSGKRKEVEKLFFEQMIAGKLIPAGRILANARPESPMRNYNNCFTIDIEDSMIGIYDSLKEDALISKMGGGVGFDISKLRPKGDRLSGGGQSSGVVSFLRIFDQSAKTIVTGGQRRSAHIALLDITHPDVEEFITVKQGDSNKELTQFNISVKINNAFVRAVEDDLDWELVFGGRVYKSVKARYLYDLLARNAYLHNEPGIFNTDHVEKYNNGWWAFRMDRVNPCGELVMPSYSLCCLSAVNLARFVKNPFTKNAAFDFDSFRETVSAGIRFLDNVLDRTEYPLEKIEKFSKQWRRIGLGFTALGDMFAMMGIRYGGKESIALAGSIAKELRDASYTASAYLAGEKGTFPACDTEKLMQAEFIKTLPGEIRELILKNGLRNIQLNTVAPTGTTSLSVGHNCSSGIEPIFALQYERTIRTGIGNETRKETVYDYAWLKFLEFRAAGTETEKNAREKAIVSPAPDSRETTETRESSETRKMAETGTAPEAMATPDIRPKPENAEIPSWFVTTLDIDPVKSIDMQAEIQKYIDHSISKTLNLPPGTTFEEYKGLFMYAYKKGLKGFTSFNPEGSMKGILEYSGKEKNMTIRRVLAPKRPKELPCDIHQIKIRGKKYIVLAGILNGSLYEIFVIDDPDNHIDLGKYSRGIVRKERKGWYNLVIESGPVEAVLKNFTKSFDSPNSSLARFISMALRHGTPLQFIVDQLAKDTNFEDFERVISRVLKSYIVDGEEVISGDSKCAECGSSLIFREGCITCPDCGWSKCT